MFIQKRKEKKRKEKEKKTGAIMIIIMVVAVGHMIAPATAFCVYILSTLNIIH